MAAAVPDLRISESLTLAYFAIFPAAALARGIEGPARARVVAFAAGPIALTLLLAWNAQPGLLDIARDWLPALWLIVGYWIPRDLIRGRHQRFERWLLAVDQWWFATPAGRALRGAPRAVHEMLELAYLCVYPMVPAGLVAVLAAGAREHVDLFWTIVLAAEFACYACLPLAATRPPRELEEPLGGPGARAAVRRLNLLVLGRASNHWNTFPSGHVAGSAAIAIAIAAVAPGMAPPFILLAIGITVGSVSGRYHYLADAVVGLAVAVAAGAIALRLA